MMPAIVPELQSEQAKEIPNSLWLQWVTRHMHMNQVLTKKAIMLLNFVPIWSIHTMVWFMTTGSCRVRMN